MFCLAKSSSARLRLSERSILPYSSSIISPRLVAESSAFSLVSVVVSSRRESWPSFWFNFAHSSSCLRVASCKLRRVSSFTVLARSCEDWLESWRFSLFISSSCSWAVLHRLCFIPASSFTKLFASRSLEARSVSWRFSHAISSACSWPDLWRLRMVSSFSLLETVLLPVRTLVCSTYWTSSFAPPLTVGTVQVRFSSRWLNLCFVLPMVIKEHPEISFIS